DIVCQCFLWSSTTPKKIGGERPRHPRPACRLIFRRQIAALALSEPALVQTFLPRVQRRPHFAEVGKILREPDELEVQLRISVFGERYNAQPHHAPGYEPG